MPDSVAHIVDDLLTQLRSGPQDVLWSGAYEDGDSLVRDVKHLATGVHAGDAHAVERLRWLFLPIAVLQETANASGWADEYMRLADRMDATGA